MARYAIPPPNEEAAFEELVDIIEMLPRFSLVFALCASDAAATEHIARFRSLHPNLRIASVRFTWADGRVYERLLKTYEQEKPNAIFVTGMEAWTNRDEEAKGNIFTQALNHARDSLHENVLCPVVFWCNLPVYNHIRRNAHDFYSVATATLRVSVSDGEVYSLTPNLQAIQSLSKGERQARITELKGQIGNLLVEDPVSSVTNEQMNLFHYLGLLLYMESHFLEAESILERIKNLANTVTLYETPTYARIITDLSLVEQSLGNYSVAKSLLEQALSITELTLGRQSLNYAITLHNLASVEQSLGNYSVAKSLLEQALSIKESTLGRQHPMTANTLHELAQIEQSLGNYSVAKSLLEQALSIKESTLGRQHPSTAITLNILAQIEQSLGNYSVAKSLLEQSLSIKESMLGRQHPSTATTLHDLAYLAYLAGNLTEAQGLAEEARTIYVNSLGEGHPHTKVASQTLNRIYQAQRKKPKLALK